MNKLKARTTPLLKSGYEHKLYTPEQYYKKLETTYAPYSPEHSA